MVLIKLVQGAVTSFIPPGLNSITQGIVGSVGMTSQVSMNEMMNHLGTAIIVLLGSLLAYTLYPNIGLLFIVSPIACAGVIFFLNRIQPEDIDHDAARGLVNESSTSSSKASLASSRKEDYTPPLPDSEEYGIKTVESTGSRKDPSYRLGWGNSDSVVESNVPKADTPLQVLSDPRLLTFLVILFLFHMSNATILPLVMQSLAIGNGRSGILMSGMCIILSQITMVAAANICGNYSARYGRKVLFLVGLFTLPVRCAILTFLIGLKEADGGAGSIWLQIAILSSQILDGVGAGTLGTMYILVTSDISSGTGRFSMSLGLTTTAMSIGGTVSGYLGEALAQDIGYAEAFFILGVMAMVPALLYLFCMPETLQDFSNESAKATFLKRKSMASITEVNEETKPYIEMT